MTTPKHNIAESLLDLEPHQPSSRQQFDEQAKRLFEQKLTAADWIRLLAMGLGGLGGAVVCGFLAATEPAETPALTRFILAALACIGLFWTVLAASLARRGASSSIHRAIAAKMGFLFSLAATVLIGVLSLAGVGEIPAVGLVLLPLATLLLATVVVIGHEIRQAELRLQQKLIEVEYRLARLSETSLLRQSGRSD
jgi:hypothetical protein